MSDKLLTITEVIDQVRLSKASITRLRSVSKFPQPIIIGERKIAWRQSVIDGYLESRKQAGGRAA